ncbi:hypothetical protein Hamer_G026698, partial [Homarus americanus]
RARPLDDNIRQYPATDRPKLTRGCLVQAKPATLHHLTDVSDREASNNNVQYEKIKLYEAVTYSDMWQARVVDCWGVEHHVEGLRRQEEVPCDKPHRVACADEMDQVPLASPQLGEQLVELVGHHGAFDSDENDLNRLLVFATDKGLDDLVHVKHWASDGTFKCCPNIFYQLYTLHVQVGKFSVPRLFALLPNKTQETYTRLCPRLLELRPGLNPES